MTPPLRIGTRASRLALAQTTAFADLLAEPAELVEIATSGDRGGGDDKSRWVDEIERALLDGRIDLAVHSAKDVPADLVDGLELAGAPARADARDVLCGAAGLADLAPGARVGTGSLRRASQLRALRPDLDVRPLAGNVDTRLRRLAAGDFDAIVLAAAGLTRLGRGDGVPLDELVPAPGQGTLALEARTGDDRVSQAIAGLRDPVAEAELAAERALVRALGAGCHTPVGARAEHRDGELELRAYVGLPDGSAWVRDELRGTDAARLGIQVGERLLVAGAREMLG